MENKKNYQLEMEKVIAQAKREGDVPTLFLHSCCAPCSSYVLEYLSKYFAYLFQCTRMSILQAEAQYDNLALSLL